MENAQNESINHLELLIRWIIWKFLRCVQLTEMAPYAKCNQLQIFVHFRWLDAENSPTFRQYYFHLTRPTTEIENIQRNHQPELLQFLVLFPFIRNKTN